MGLAALHTQLAAGRLQELLPLVPGAAQRQSEQRVTSQLTAGCMCSNSDKAAACPARCRRAAHSLPMPATCRLWGLGAAESRQEGREGPLEAAGAAHTPRWPRQRGAWRYLSPPKPAAADRPGTVDAAASITLIGFIAVHWVL